jgi:hypothetical protein
MEVLCKFKGWMQSQIKEISITCVILDQNPTPVQRLSAFNNPWSIQYISHFERNLYAGAMFEWIQNPRNGEYIAIFWWSLTPAQKLNAIKIKRNAKYISHVGWKSYAGSKVECNHKSRKYQLLVPFGIKILRRFKGWAHSTINEVFNTSLILKGIFMPVQCLNEFKIQEMVNTSCFFNEVLRRLKN